MTARLDKIAEEITALAIPMITDGEAEDANFIDIANNPSFSFELPMLTYFGMETKVVLMDQRQAGLSVTVYDAMTGHNLCSATFTASVPASVIAAFAANFMN